MISEPMYKRKDSREMSTKILYDVKLLTSFEISD
jgi:hypothetical protein